MKPIVVGLSVVAIVAGSIAGPTPASASSSAQQAPPTDAQVVAALAYGAGLLARELGTELGSDVPVPGDFDVATYRRDALAASRDVLRTEVPRLTPVLADLRSGDVVRAEHAAADLGVIVVEPTRAAMDRAGVDAAPATNQPSSRVCGVAVVCVAYAAAGVHNAVVATAAAAVVISVALWCGAWTWCGKAVSGSQSEAARESLAVAIAATVR